MRERFKPVILLGLGKYGAEIARGVYTALGEKEKDLAKVASCFVLGEDGEYRDIGENESLFKCDGLKLELSSGDFSTNLRIIQNQEKKFVDLLADTIENMRRREIIVELQDKGYEIEENICLFVISTLFDSIGSAAIIPFLDFIQHLSSGRLRGTTVNTNILAFLPDLFEESRRDDLAYSRSYSCLQELELVADHPDIISSENESPFSVAWILGGKSEENAEIGGYKNLIPMISEIIWSLLTREIASDISFSTAFLRKVDGKRTRYSSFGLAKFVFPVNSMMRGLSSWLGFSILESKGVTIPKVFDSEYIGADVSKFLLENKLDELSDELEVDAEGKTIWIDFEHKGVINESAAVENFVSDMEEEARDFGENQVLAMSRKLSLRKEQLFDEKTGKLFDLIEREIDSEEKGIYWGKAFLDVLQNEKSVYTKGDIIEKIYTLDTVENKIKSFFDRIFGVDRERLGELKHDIDDKTSLLKELEKEPEDEKRKEGLKERVGTLEIDIEHLSKEYARLSKETADFDVRIRDASERRKLLGDLENETKEEMKKVRTDLQETDERYREEKQKIDELHEERRRIIKKLFITFPCAGTAAFFVIIYLISRLPGVSLLYMLRIGGMLYPFGLIGYGIWGLSRYWKRVTKEMQEATARVMSLKTEKMTLLFKYQKLYNGIFKTRFEHSLHGGLLEWIGDYKGSVVKTGNKLQCFIDGLVESSRKEKEAWESFGFRNTLFVRSVVKKEDLERFVEKNVRLPIEIHRFFKEKSLSGYFNDFMNTGTLDTLGKAFGGFTEEVFSSVREKSLEEFLTEEEREGRVNIAEKLGDLYNLAKAFILLDVEKGMDVSQPLTYLGVGNSMTSYVKDVLRKQGYSDIQLSSVGNKDEITISKLKIGFPAFHIALMNYGEKLLSEGEDKKEFYVKPEWPLEELFPSSYTLGNEEDKTRVTACLGRAFGLIKEKQGSFYFEDKDLGKSYHTLIEFLRSFEGSGIRNKISKQVERRKLKEDAIDTIMVYKETKKVDEVDEKIIRRVTDELNPLA